MLRHVDDGQPFDDAMPPEAATLGAEPLNGCREAPLGAIRAGLRLF
jgi:hypothetical protein